MKPARLVPLLALFLSALPRPALAVGTDECLAAADAGQRLRSTKKLVAARREFVVCAQEVCPGPVRKDCAGWLGDVDASMPSVVPAARDATGADVPDVRLFIDGQLVAPKLVGSSIDLDPGEHVLRFEPKVGPPVDLKVVVREGEKNRPLQVTVGPAAPPPPASSAAPPPASVTSAPPPTATTAKVDAKRPAPVAAYVLAGAGVVGLGVFTVLGLSGRSDVQHLRDTCAPACPKSDEDAARRKLLFADIGLVAGVASLGVATWLFVRTDDGGRGVGLAPTPGGAAMTYGGRFQ